MAIKLLPAAEAILVLNKRMATKTMIIPLKILLAIFSPPSLNLKF